MNNNSGKNAQKSAVPNPEQKPEANQVEAHFAPAQLTATSEGKPVEPKAPETMGKQEPKPSSVAPTTISSTIATPVAATAPSVAPAPSAPPTQMKAENIAEGEGLSKEELDQLKKNNSKVPDPADVDYDPPLI